MKLLPPVQLNAATDQALAVKVHFHKMVVFILMTGSLFFINQNKQQPEKMELSLQKDTR